MLATTAHRVPDTTPESFQREIDRQIQQNVERYARQGPQAIDRRLKELDEEWDTERTLELNSATVALGGVLLGLFVSRKWNWFVALASGFMIQHVLQGWCPPMPVLRKLGVRTQTEIDRERYALKALRGDFENVGRSPDGDSRAPEDALAAAAR